MTEELRGANSELKQAEQGMSLVVWVGFVLLLVALAWYVGYRWYRTLRPVGGKAKGSSYADSARSEIRV